MKRGDGMRRMRSFLMIMSMLGVFSGCGNYHCSLLKITPGVTANQPAEEKGVKIDRENIIITEILWGDKTHYFLSEEAKIEERRVILYNVCGQIDADINSTIPMSADLLTIYPPMGINCWVCIDVNRNSSFDDDECFLFPKELD